MVFVVVYILPQENGEMKYSQCSRYAIDWQQFLNGTQWFDVQVNFSWPIEKCLNGWIYNKTNVQSSIVIDVSD